MTQKNSENAGVRPMLIPYDVPTWKNRVLPPIGDWGSRLSRAALAVLGIGLDAITVAAATGETDPEPPIQELLHLGILWPAEVDRVCAEQTRTQFLVDDFLPVKSIGIAAGESTIGKSALMCQLGLCIAAGVPFLGMPTEQSRVLYFDLENSILDGKTIRDSLVRHLGLGEAPQAFLVTPDASVDLSRALEVARPKLVIIDSLRAFRPDVTDKNRNAGE
jgi:hypothetical protein